MKLILLANYYQVLQLFSQFVNRTKSKALLSLSYKGNIRGKAVVWFRRDIANDYVIDIVICKLRYDNKFFLIILLPIDKNIEVYLYYIILSFGLIIKLEKKDCEKFSLYIKEVVK